MHVQLELESPIGPLFLVASEIGLVGLFWNQQPHTMLSSFEQETPQAAILEQARLQLNEYFTGRRQQFDLPLDLQGTEFQKRVWQALLRIPYGQSVSYSAIAASIENQKAVRAVGSANGKNPLCIIVPCHRVLPKGGDVGGYSGGRDIKAKLLQLERSVFSV